MEDEVLPSQASDEGDGSFRLSGPMRVHIGCHDCDETADREAAEPYEVSFGRIELGLRSAST